MSGLFRAELVLARAVGAVARRAGRGGTSLPGKVLVAMAPDAISRLARRLGRGSVVISATNGKTTTATMIATVLESSGMHVVHNRAGANMAGGVASTLLEATRTANGSPDELGLFEVDEFWLDRLAPQLEPRAIVLANLFRDQLDRYGELDTIADRWAAVLSELRDRSALVLNADDPLIADLGREAPNVVYYGVEDPAMAQPEMQHASDSKHCRTCGSAYAYEAIYLGHLGRYSCPGCGMRRPDPGVAARDITLDGTRGASFELVTEAGTERVRIPLPGLYNVYNALAAAALCLELGLEPRAIREGLEQVTAAFGRAETVMLETVEAQILLMKNPAGANEILRTLALEPGELDLLVILNDRIADGRDISWVWDADFELLIGHVGHITCAGTRAAELALRFKYAGVPAERLAVIPELASALQSASGRLAGADRPSAERQRLFILPTYTALLELREELAARGHAGHFWEQP